MKPPFHLFMILTLGLLLAGCVMEEGSDNPGATGGLNGQWVLKRSVLENTVNGVIVRDTAVYETTGLERSFLVIDAPNNGAPARSDEFYVRWDFVAAKPETTASVPMEGNVSLEYARSGNTLVGTLTLGSGEGRIVFRSDYDLHVGVFPPADWTSGAGSPDGLWLTVREIYTLNPDYPQVVSDTIIHDTSDPAALTFLRVGGDSLFVVDLDGEFLLSTERANDGAGWITEDGSTFDIIARTSSHLYVEVTGLDWDTDEPFLNRVLFVRHTGTFPPEEWDEALFKAFVAAPRGPAPRLGGRGSGTQRLDL